MIALVSGLSGVSSLHEKGAVRECDFPRFVTGVVVRHNDFRVMKILCVDALEKPRQLGFFVECRHDDAYHFFSPCSFCGNSRPPMTAVNGATVTRPKLPTSV